MIPVHAVAARNISIVVADDSMAYFDFLDRAEDESCKILSDSHLLFQQVPIVLHIFPKTVKTANATDESSHDNAF